MLVTQRRGIIKLMPHKDAELYFIKKIGDRECSKQVCNHLVYCKFSDDIAVDSESKLLLTRAGRWFLLDITNQGK